VEGVSVPAAAEWDMGGGERFVLRLVRFEKLKPEESGLDQLRIVWPEGSQVRNKAAGNRLTIVRERGLFDNDRKGMNNK
nr:hypothetical protein [Acidobacteriota bacterium]